MVRRTMLQSAKMVFSIFNVRENAFDTVLSENNGKYTLD